MCRERESDETAAGPGGLGRAGHERRPNASLARQLSRAWLHRYGRHGGCVEGEREGKRERGREGRERVRKRERGRKREREVERDGDTEFKCGSSKVEKS